MDGRSDHRCGECGIEGRIQEAPDGVVAMGGRESIGRRQEPTQKIEGAGEDGHVGSSAQYWAFL